MDIVLTNWAEAAYVANEFPTEFRDNSPELPTTLFSSTRPESVRRNVAWQEELLDPSLLAAVQLILAPVMNKQWNYDAAVDKLQSAGVRAPGN